MTDRELDARLDVLTNTPTPGARYKCHKCEAEHSEDNMVAYCAACYDRLRCDLVREHENFLRVHRDNMALVNRVAGLVAAFERMQEFHDCMEAQRKDEPLPEGHDDPDEACGDGICYQVGEVIKRGIAAAKDSKPILDRVRARAKADAYEDAAVMMMSSMPAKVHDELNARAAALREGRE